MIEPQITHWETCYLDGPKHYACALRKIEELEVRVFCPGQTVLTCGIHGEFYNGPRLLCLFNCPTCLMGKPND